MKRANVLRTAFGVAIAFGLVFDQPGAPERPVGDGAAAAALVEAALTTRDAHAPHIVEAVATHAVPDACAAHGTAAAREPAATQREL
jgi:hypothetical protein